jgi:hypothetical protein
MKNPFFKKYAFAIIIIANIVVTVLYFKGKNTVKSNDHFAHLGDAFLVIAQVVINYLLGVLFEGLDESREENKFKLGKSFFLSAILTLLIGFGLCTSN